MRRADDGRRSGQWHGLTQGGGGGHGRGAETRCGEELGFGHFGALWADYCVVVGL